MVVSRNIKALTPSFVAAFILVIICAQPYFGFFLYFFVLVWLFWLPYSAYITIKNPQLRKLQAMRVALWLSAASLIFFIHLIRHNYVRNDANALVFKVQAYAATHRQYPASLSEIGLSREELKNKLGMGFYHRDEAGKPFVIYAVTFEPFSTFSYDFEKQIWVYQPD